MRFTPVGFLPNGSGAMPAKPDKQKEEDKTMKNAKRMICIILGLCFIAMIGCNKEEKAEKEAPDNGAGIELAQEKDSQQESEQVETDISATYKEGLETIEELKDKSVLIVQATVASLDKELELGVHWKLSVKRSNAEGIKDILLVQLKDGYLLNEGAAVVLALVPDYDEGIYCIPGGGDGILFCTNGAKVNGDLLDSLLKKAGYTGTKDALTAESVYDMLVGIA